MTATFIFASDIHGSERKVDELVKKGIEMGGVDLILGGDLLYPGGNQPMEDQASFLEDVFQARIEDYPGRVLSIFGNNDLAAVTDRYGELCPGIDVIHQDHTLISGCLKVFGTSHVPVTPFPIKDWEAVERHSGQVPPGRLEGLTSRGGKVKRYTVPSTPTIMDILDDLKFEVGSILVSHGPPFDTHADVNHSGNHLGSRDLREFMRRKKPMAVLCGHIHEAPSVSGSFVEKYDGTLVANPGNRRSSFTMLVGKMEEELSIEPVTIPL